jgi:uncharacterized protein YndB with AHSA1/START domain
MKRREVNVTATTTAAPEAVYRLLADASTWPAWSTIDSVELEKQGVPPPEGVGAIRVNTRGRTTGRDEILELVPNRRLKYATLSGVPVRDYVGEVDLTPVAGGGTTVHWHSSFFPKTPGTGWLMERGIHKFLAGVVEGLVTYAPTADTARDVTSA